MKIKVPKVTAEKISKEDDRLRKFRRDWNEAQQVARR